MKLAPNPRYPALVDILRRYRQCLGLWQGDGFRCTALAYARSEKLIDGQGAYAQGCRWSAPQVFRCVNLSTAAHTAWQESQARFAHYGLREEILQPRVIAGVRLKLHSVLNLAESAELAGEAGLAEMLAEDWHGANDSGSESLGQAFGRAAGQLEAEALVVPSAQVEGGVNIVVFPEFLRVRSRIQVIGEEELDQWLKKG